MLEITCHVRGIMSGTRVTDMNFPGFALEFSRLVCLLVLTCLTGFAVGVSVFLASLETLGAKHSQDSKQAVSFQKYKLIFYSLL